jgi:hypothetical protein
MAITDDHHPPFEGPEKLLEIWFAPSATDVPDAAKPSTDGRIGLRKIDRKIWEEMLDIVKCQVLSVIEGIEMDAYLLRFDFILELIVFTFTDNFLVNHLSSSLPIASSLRLVEQL